MRRPGVGMTAAVLAAALAASAAAAQSADGDLRSMPAKQPMWWDGWFAAPAAKPAPPPKPDAAKPDAAKPDAAKPMPGPTPAETAAAARKRELAVFLRRQEVCDRLQQIAVQNGDTEMERRVDELNARAWLIYQQRTGAAAGGLGEDGAAADQQRLTTPAGGAGRPGDGRAGLYRGGKP